MIPTVEQVREHAERCPVNHKGFNGCLWLMQWDSLLPEIRLLHATNGVVEIWDEGEHEWLEYSDFYDPIRCDPCDQLGNPLPLVDRLASLEEVRRANVALIALDLEQAARAYQARDAAVARAEKAEAEAQRLEDELERHAVRETELRVARQERDEYRRRLNDAERELAALGRRLP